MATLQLPEPETCVEPRTHRWTSAEYSRMAELGLFDGRRVELVDGEILDMPPQKNWHFVTVKLVEDAVSLAFGRSYWVRTQGPLALSLMSEPEPDVAVVPGKPREFVNHPATALLVVEISDTTLAYDRGRKASLYARAGIADYWIVNLIDCRLEVYRNPVPDASQPHGFGYASNMPLKPNETVSPLAASQAKIRVADILP